MIRLSDISLPPEHSAHQLPFEAARMLRIPNSKIRGVRIVRRSVDARKKPNVRIIYTIDVTVDGSEKKILKQSGCKRASIAPATRYKPPKSAKAPEKRPVVVGFGPGGMFAALILALAGWKPLGLERGEDAESRHEKVEKFFQTGELDTKSNVQFGEGGAGTFSDGKLHTGTKNERGRWVLEQFVRAGAQEEILYDAKPHVGTDVLFEVVQNLRRRIISLGGEVRFGAKLTGLLTENGALCGAEYVQEGEKKLLPCEKLILAIGHSARDTFRALAKLGVPMEAKPFSMGVRIEHPQREIDMAQYGMPRGKALPAADYKLSCHLPDGSSAYTFCMCPGGYVVAAASQEGAVATNGMSYSGRGGENANAALLVTLKPEDFPEQGVFGGMHWQEEIEKKAFLLAGSTYAAPAQTVGDFLANRPSAALGTVMPTYRPGVTPCDLHTLFPEIITKTLEQAIPELDGALHGFASPDAVMTAPETRSSSPIRILRGENRQSSIAGLYPCGEGAGYAGGILSAAVDGMLCAEAIVDSLM